MMDETRQINFAQQKMKLVKSEPRSLEEELEGFLVSVLSAVYDRVSEMRGYDHRLGPANDDDAEQRSPELKPDICPDDDQYP